MSNIKTKITSNGVISEKIADTEIPTFSLEIDGSKGFTSKTRSELHIYVDSANGDDGNAGTVDKPLKTLTEAESRIPDVIEHKTFVHLASGSYDGVPFRQRLYRDSLFVIGDGAGRPGDDGFTVISSSLTVQGGSTTTSTVLPSGLGSDTLLGKTMLVVSGATSGSRRTILKNDDTTINTFALGSALSSGDVVRIVEPAAEILWDSSQAVTGGGNLSDFVLGYGPEYLGSSTLLNTTEPSLIFANVKLDEKDTTGLDRWQVRGRTIFYGVEISAGGSTVIMVGNNNDALLLGFDTSDGNGTNATIPVEAGLVDDVDYWAGWGMYSTATTNFLINFVKGTSCINGPANVFMGKFAMLAGRAIGGGNSGLEASPNFITSIGSNVSVRLATFNNSFLQIDSDSADGAILLAQNCDFYATTDSIVVSNSNGPGVEARGPFVNAMFDGEGTYSGGTYGIYAYQGARVRIQEDDTNNNISGDTANFAVGPTPATTGSLTGNGTILKEASYADFDGSYIIRSD